MTDASRVAFEYLNSIYDEQTPIILGPSWNTSKYYGRYYLRRSDVNIIRVSAKSMEDFFEDLPSGDYYFIAVHSTKRFKNILYAENLTRYAVKEFSSCSFSRGCSESFVIKFKK